MKGTIPITVVFLLLLALVVSFVRILPADVSIAGPKEDVRFLFIGKGDGLEYEILTTDQRDDCRSAA